VRAQPAGPAAPARLLRQGGPVHERDQRRRDPAGDHPGLNSAIAAFYYLRIVRAAYLEAPDEDAPETRDAGIQPRVAAAMLSAGSVIVLLAIAQPLITNSVGAAQYVRPRAGVADHAPTAPATTPETPPVEITRADG
jgi:hypothetical protein